MKLKKWGKFMRKETKEVFFKFLNKEISAECFENWLYQDESLENELSVYDYTDFLSFKYKHDTKIKLHVADLFFTIVDSKEFDDYKFSKLLNNALKNEDALEYLLIWSYDMYYYGNKDLAELGLQYGTDLLLYKCDQESPPPWGNRLKKRVFTDVEKAAICKEILRIKGLFESGELCISYDYE